MFTARFELSAAHSEEAVLSCAAAFDRDGYALSIHRVRDDGHAPWIAEFSSVQQPDISFLAQYLNAAGLMVDSSASPKIQEISDDTDWLSVTYQGFPAFSVGPFFVHGRHHVGAPPTGQIPLIIDAATAFGSGEHGTTRGCLRAMIDLKSKGVCPWNVLDMGTGSGILGIAAWKLWKSPVLAVDNDPEAVSVAIRYRDLNDVPSAPTGMTCAVGDGFQTPEVDQKKPYELIIANILAAPLKTMAQAAADMCDVRGWIILSGLLQTQADDILETYAQAGFDMRDRFDIDEWSTLVMQKRA